MKPIFLVCGIRERLTDEPDFIHNDCIEPSFRLDLIPLINQCGQGDAMGPLLTFAFTGSSFRFPYDPHTRPLLFA